MLKVFRRKAIPGGLILSVGLLALTERSDGAQEDKTAKHDRELVAKIEKAVAKDDSLPASSAKIAVTIENGVVTLKGTVQSDAVSQAVQAKAESLVIQETPRAKAPDSDRVQVRNQLVVIPTP